MSNFTDILSQLFHDLKFTYYDDSCLETDEGFESKFLAPYERQQHLDPDAVSENLNKYWRRGDQAAREYACISISCAYAVAAKRAYPEDRDKAWAYLCQAKYEYGVTVAMISEPFAIKFANSKRTAAAANARHKQGKIVREYALQLAQSWSASSSSESPLKNPNNAARRLKKAVNDYAIERFRNATDPSDPFYNKSDPRVLATGEDKGKTKDPYSERTLRDWFKDLDFEQ